MSEVFVSEGRQESFRIRHFAKKAGYKYGLIQCPLLLDGKKCGKRFVYGSELWYGHLLFVHGHFVEPCMTFNAKVNATHVIEGFKYRTVAKKMKASYRRSLSGRKKRLWRFTLRDYMQKVH